MAHPVPDPLLEPASLPALAEASAVVASAPPLDPEPSAVMASVLPLDPEPAAAAPLLDPEPDPVPPPSAAS
jgi:hypothetical protein